MIPMSTRRSAEHMAECLYRLAEMRQWLNSNVLFPVVSDVIVDALREQLLAAEHVLLSALYDRDQLEAVRSMIQAMSAPPRMGVEP